MKRFISFLTLFIAICAVTIAKPYSVSEIPNVQLADRHRYTSNPDGILSNEAVQAIDLACDSLRTKGVAQVAVVAINDIASDDVFTFAHKLFSSWGVGSDKSDNGLGIILVLDKREIRFVTGYGLEGILPDAVCKRIQQRYMVGPLGAGDYDKGMVEGVAAVATLLSSGELPTTNEEELTTEDIIIVLGSMFTIFVLFVLLIVVIYRAAHRCPRCGKHHLKQVNSQIVKNSRLYQVIDKTFVCPDCGHSLIKRVRQEKANAVIIGGGGSRGGFGGGGFGGGFGGGSFGGGGAGSRF
ncbi:MAG: TPM domain-containing protein [Alistipes sp.]|nr:TPM domain-containing protein [Alistipes sp.]